METKTVHLFSHSNSSSKEKWQNDLDGRKKVYDTPNKNKGENQFFHFNSLLPEVSKKI